jgi:hypothetical protein
MNSYTFSVSLRINHPSRDLGYMTSELGMVPSTSWIAGDDRKTPKGTVLGGKRTNSYWVARLNEEEESSEAWQIEDFLEHWFNELLPHADTLSEIHNSGGNVIIYISLYSGRNFGVILNPKLLAKFGTSNFEIQLDMYPE